MLSSDSTSPQLWGRMPYPYNGLHLGSGNRCGHDPLKPALKRFKTPLTRDRQFSKTIQKLIDGVDRYYWQPAALPTLAYVANKRNKDGLYRQNRSEAREGQVLLMKAIIAATDFATMLVGVPLENGNFVHRSVEYIAKQCGLMSDKDDRVPSRVWRLMRDMRLSGFIELFQQYEVIQGQWETRPDGQRVPMRRAKPAIKSINPNFLLAMGVVSKSAIKRLRDNRSKNLQEVRKAYQAQYKPSIEDEAVQARHQLTLNQAQVGAYKQPNTPKPPKAMPKAGSLADREQYGREKSAYFADLRANNRRASDRDLIQIVKNNFPEFDDWLMIRDRQRPS